MSNCNQKQEPRPASSALPGKAPVWTSARDKLDRAKDALPMRELTVQHSGSTQESIHRAKKGPAGPTSQPLDTSKN